jgi:hypothetical protein
MGAEQQPQFTGREVLTAGSAEANKLESGINKGQRYTTENQKPERGLGPEVEGDSHQDKAFDSVKEKLIAEWKPTGVTEETAVIELVQLYFKRGLVSDRICAAEQKEQNIGSWEAIAKFSKKEMQAAVNARNVEQISSLTPQQRVRRDLAHLEQLIRDKIEFIHFLKTTKKKITKLSPPDPVVPSGARKPRGAYRERFIKPFGDPSARKSLR